MNFIEYHTLIQNNLPFLRFNYTYDRSNEEKRYLAKGLDILRKTINNLEEIPYISNNVAILKESSIFKTTSSELRLTSDEQEVINAAVNTLRIKLQTFLEIAESSKLYASKETLYIRIPEIGSFDNLAKYANDLKKAIELPITDPAIDGKVEILSADEGSIIFFISVGTIAAVKLVAGICWAAAVIKKKRAEANIFEQHTKTLELKNEMMNTFVEAQKAQLNNILDAEARAIADKNYNHNDPETIERLKLSINTVNELIDKGVKILPLNKEEDVQKQFPDYSKLDLIESSIKQISNS
ncbi:hypothetical protein [Chryseobacterium oranimense]|uniref:hypothetical protein n=1 Tax=Chryseobacterium oranimense TaxID=421058 RepID=UPI0031D502FB